MHLVNDVLLEPHLLQLSLTSLSKTSKVKKHFSVPLQMSDPNSCCINQFCGVLFAVLNLIICTLYTISVILLALSCGHECYPLYFDPHWHLDMVIMIASVLLLYIIGFIVSFVAYKRGIQEMSGCSIWIIGVIILLLICTLAFCTWNFYDIFAPTDHAFPFELYPVMVIINFSWNILLILFTLNVLQKTEDDVDEENKGSFTELHRKQTGTDNEDEDDCSASEKLTESESLNAYADDDNWRNLSDSTANINCYNGSYEWSSNKTESAKKIKFKRIAYGAGSRKAKRRNKARGNPFGEKSRSSSFVFTKPAAFPRDASNSHNAWK